MKKPAIAPVLKDYAVIVGINRYDAKPFARLKGAVKDAQEFRKWVLKEGAVVKEISYHDRPVILQDIVDVFNEVFAEVTVQRGRRLYIFFAGHGFALDRDDSSLIASDSHYGFVQSISSRLLMKFFETAPFFDEVILVADCCRARDKFIPPDFPWTLANLGVDEGEIPERVNLKKLFAAYATVFGRKSREQYDKRHSAFRGIFSRAFEKSIGYGIKRLRPFTTFHLGEVVKRKMRDQEPGIFAFDSPPITIRESKRSTNGGVSLTLRIIPKMRSSVHSISLIDGKGKAFAHLSLATASALQFQATAGLYQIHMTYPVGRPDLHYFEVLDGNVFLSKSGQKYVTITV